MPSLRSWQGRVDLGWIDANSHMSEGWFGVVFGMATDAVLVDIGADPARRHATGGAFYTVETHIAFLAEVGPGATLAVDTTVVGVDLLRLHLFHRLLVLDGAGGGDPTGGTGETVATQESLLFHVDTVADRVGPMADAVLAAATTLAAAHRDAVDPDLLGRAIAGP